MSHVIIYITTKTQSEARKIGRILLKEKLVACINIIPRVESMYRWKGKLEHHCESGIIAKTKKSLVDDVISTVKKNHSYTVPCVVALPIEKGNLDFLKWIDEVTK